MEIVNGYACRNCAEAGLASRGIDPARPADGPDGVFAAEAAQTTIIPRAEPPRLAAMRHEGSFVDITA